MIIIMCDGASKGNPGPASIGIIEWKRTTGTSSARRYKPTDGYNLELEGEKTNNEAEWEALLEALYLLKRKNYRKEAAYIYTDSLLIVMQINGKYVVNSDKLKGYYEEGKELLYNLRRLNQLDVEIQWIPKQLTYLADKEANKAGNQKKVGDEL